MSEDVILPEGLEAELNKAAASVSRPVGAKKVFIAVPNMCYINAGLAVKLFGFAGQIAYQPYFYFCTERRHVDYARNLIAQAFIEGKQDYLCMIDHDVDPHKDLMSLIELDKDIIAANVHCWINAEIMPSMWQLAECESCRVARLFEDKGEILDKTQFRLAHGNMNVLERWNPFRQHYEPFVYREPRDNGFTLKHLAPCRCRGTGLDPWVYRTHQQILGDARLMKVDSVGSAAMIIARRVFEKVPFPWFRFLYRESGEILLTEDHYFCWKAGLQGFEVWGDPQLVCSHFKTLDLLAVNMRMIKSIEMGVEYQKRVHKVESAVSTPAQMEVQEKIALEYT